MDYYQRIAGNFQQTIELIAMSVDALAQPIEIGSQMMTEALLQDRKILACGNGAEGLYMYLRNHDQYSAVILDLIMPEVGGDVFLQVVESLVKSKTLQPFPFVIVNTAVDDFTHLKKLSEYECVYDVCSKPVSPEKLIRFIDQIQTSLPIR